MAHNTFHVALYVRDLDAAIARYRKLLGQEPAKVRHDYAKFEITDPPYAKADKFWVRDADGMPWEMYTLIEDAEAETAADPTLRRFLDQEGTGPRGACC